MTHVTEQARRTVEDLVILGLVLLILFMAGMLVALWTGEAADRGRIPPVQYGITGSSGGFEHSRRF